MIQLLGLTSGGFFTLNNEKTHIRITYLINNQACCVYTVNPGKSYKHDVCNDEHEGDNECFCLQKIQFVHRGLPITDIEFPACLFHFQNSTNNAPCIYEINKNIFRHSSPS